MLGAVHFLVFVNFMWKNTGISVTPKSRCHLHVAIVFSLLVVFKLSTFHLDTFIVNE